MLPMRKVLSVVRVVVTSVFTSTVVRDEGSLVVKSSSPEQSSCSDESDSLDEDSITRYTYVTITSRSHTINVDVNCSV